MKNILKATLATILIWAAFIAAVGVISRVAHGEAQIFPDYQEQQL